MKEYVTPELEIFRFRTEEIMDGLGPSSIINPPGGGGTEPIFFKIMNVR